ncbi:hypothetical protein AB0N73_02790 [Microbacterium sp. NPDC089189]|uniref:hypothetical protein n=1 Tax=Microbacterium sp. NPDC089189 TaxID=3154972 RepID=UPI0034239716
MQISELGLVTARGTAQTAAAVLAQIRVRPFGGGVEGASDRLGNSLVIVTAGWVAAHEINEWRRTVAVIDLMNVVALLSDWRTVRPFECDAVVKRKVSGEESLVRVHADPRHSSYTAVDSQSGEVWSYDDQTRRTVFAGHVVERHPYDLPYAPDALQLAFPLTLPIWGRRADRFRMAAVSVHETQFVVALEGQGDWNGYGAELTIDRLRGVAVRFDAPDLLLEFGGIKDAPSLYLRS